MNQHVSFLVGLLSQRCWDSYNIAHNDYTSVTIYIIETESYLYLVFFSLILIFIIVAILTMG